VETKPRDARTKDRKTKGKKGGAASTNVPESDTTHDLEPERVVPTSSTTPATTDDVDLTAGSISATAVGEATTAGLSAKDAFAASPTGEALTPEGGLGGLAHIWTDQRSDSATAPLLAPAPGASLSAPSLAAPSSIWDASGGVPASGALPMSSLQQAFSQSSLPTPGTWSGGYSSVPGSDSHHNPSAGKSPTAAGQSPQHVHSYTSLVSQPPQSYYPAAPQYSSSRMQVMMPGGGYAMYQQQANVVYADQSAYAIPSHFSGGHHPTAFDNAEHALSADAPTFTMPQGEAGIDQSSGPVDMASLTRMAGPTAVPRASPMYENQHSLRVQADLQSQPVAGTPYQYHGGKFVQQPLLYAGEYSPFPAAYMQQSGMQQSGGGALGSQYGQMTGGVQYQGVGQVGSAAPVGSQRPVGQRGALPDSLIPHLTKVSVLGESNMPQRVGGHGGGRDGGASAAPAERPRPTAERHHQPAQRQAPLLQSAIPTSLFGLEAQVAPPIAAGGDRGPRTAEAYPTMPATAQGLEILYTFESSVSTPPSSSAAFAAVTPAQLPAPPPVTAPFGGIAAPDLQAPRATATRGRSMRGRGRSGGRSRGRGRRGQEAAKKVDA
jgi:hypothetical protein